MALAALSVVAALVIAMAIMVLLFATNWLVGTGWNCALAFIGLVVLLVIPIAGAVRPVTFRTTALTYSIISSGLGSVFVGFSQCGGFHWYWQALELHTLACCVVLGIVVREPRPQYPIRAIAAIGLILGIVRFGLSAGLSIYMSRWTWDLFC